MQATPVTRRHVVRGVAAVAIASVVMRAGGLIAQIVAGYVLTAGDFGLFAATLGFGAISAALLSTLRPLFIQRISAGQPVDVLWRAILLVLVGFAVVLVVFAGSVAAVIGRPDAVWLVRLMALTLPLQFAQIIGGAHLSASLRFAESSKIHTAAVLARHGSLVVFALAGFGAYALVLPIFVESLLLIALLHRAGCAFPPLVGQVRGVLGRYGSTLAWLLVTAVGLALSISGDYLFLGRLETAAIVGFYFFGYQLSAALTQPFTMAATSILVPSFASINDDTGKLQRTFLEAIALLLVVSSLVFGLLAVSAGAIVNLVWQGDWNPAVAVIVIMGIGTPFRILLPTCYSLLQATAQWRRLALVMFVGAAGAVIPAVVGAAIGGLQAIATGATLGAVFGGLIAAVLVGNTIDIPWLRTTGTLAQASFAPLVGIAVTFTIFPGFVVSLPVSILRIAVYTFAAAPTALALYGDALGGLADHLRGNRA